jgi:hypothetical protein
MPGTTATQKLTYPTSGDNLKEQAQYLETLARQVDARAKSNAAILASQLDRPFAIIDCTIPNVISTTAVAAIKFDSVVLDTAGLVDLSADQRVITLPPGYWLLGGYVDFIGSPGGSNCTTGAITLRLNCDNATPNVWSQFAKDFADAHTTIQCSGLAQVLSPALPGKQYLTADIAYGTGCTFLLTAFTARMWAFRTRDL